MSSWKEPRAELPKQRKVVEASRAEAKLYLAKALEFLEEARAALSESRRDAAILNAVHAAISAADAATAASAGVRSANPDHQRTADLLEEVTGRSTRPAVHIGQFRKLLSKKNLVEYLSRRATATEAKEEVIRAERFVAWAKRFVE